MLLALVTSVMAGARLDRVLRQGTFFAESQTEDLADPEGALVAPSDIVT